MGNVKITENPPYFHDEEKEMIEEFERSLDGGMLVSHLTPARKAELEASARHTIDLMEQENNRAWQRKVA
uniref:Uncharacterized protein n=1 Tax=Candidatus Kentrum sp. LPFa TaxID=2126335 RepID=A0A450XIC9_9GAMM|nr:MAG: hypothetical protein BECKLPF1236A_GA0070988_1008011 [Candidatus Kentron sp. LPFa]VFK29047.1 MAG: hypothetical protein BECKLPF1236C_GA0070990_1007912 [Candidatus Kentron sp. LPFa]